MKTTITFKLAPENKGELAHTFQSSFEEFMASMEIIREGGGFGNPHKVEFRVILDVGGVNGSGSGDQEEGQGVDGGDSEISHPLLIDPSLLESPLSLLPA